MLRIWLFAGVLGLAIADDVLVLKKISRTTSESKAPGEKQIEICFTGGAASYHHFHLSVILNMDDGAQDQGKSVNVVDKCATFAGDIGALGTDTVEFIFTGQSETDETADFGTAIIKLPDILDPLTAHWVDGNSLRVKEGDMKGFKIGNVECIQGDGDPCYFIGINKPADNKPVLQLCQSVEEETPGTKTISICDLTHKNALTADTANTISSLDLQYKGDGTVQKMIMNREDGTISEIVIYSGLLNNILKVCGTPTIPNDCALSGYAQGDKDINVLVVGIDTDPVDSTVHTITDLNLVGTPLSASLLEIRWTGKTGVTADKYHAVRTAPTELDKEFTETIVTCSDPGTKSKFHCFAYFTELTGKKSYDVTVQPGDGTTNIDTNKVTLLGTTTPKAFISEGMELKVSSLDTKWHKGLRSFEVNTCIHHANTSNLFTYEAILINKRGQWKKVNEVTHRIGNELCFDALHVDIYNFDLSEDMTLVVVKRGSDGITVLESAQTVISVGANQKAAELSNSTTGTM